MPIFTFWLQQALADPIKGMLGTPSRLRTQISLNSGTLLEILPTLCRVNNPEILEPSLSGSPIKIYLDPSICIKHLPFELYVCYNCNTNLAKDQTGVKPHWTDEKFVFVLNQGKKRFLLRHFLNIFLMQRPRHLPTLGTTHFSDDHVWRLFWLPPYSKHSPHLRSCTPVVQTSCNGDRDTKAYWNQTWREDIWDSQLWHTCHHRPSRTSHFH